MKTPTEQTKLRPMLVQMKPRWNEQSTAVGYLTLLVTLKTVIFSKTSKSWILDKSIMNQTDLSILTHSLNKSVQTIQNFKNDMRKKPQPMITDLYRYRLAEWFLSNSNALFPPFLTFSVYQRGIRRKYKSDYNNH